MDNRDGGAGLGVAQMSSSERKAKCVAMDECLAKEGQRCKVILTYRNQCGVVVAGDAGWNSMSAESIDKASELGIERCEKDGLKGCRVYYSNCSFAERVRWSALGVALSDTAEHATENGKGICSSARSQGCKARFFDRKIFQAVTNWRDMRREKCELGI